MKKWLCPGSTGFWLLILILMLILLNLIACLIFAQASPAETLSDQIWLYLESGIFKVITISLFLPIILLFLERHFRIIESVRQNRILQESKEKEERKEKRWECIEQTSKIWNQLWDLISEVVYFKKDNRQGISIEDLLTRLRNLTTVTEDVINMWSHHFPGLPSEYEGSFLILYNIEINSAETVAWCIRQGDGEDEIRRMQNALKRIVNSINYLVHHRLISVLKDSITLLELKERNVPKSKQKGTKDLIKKRVKHIKEWADLIDLTERNENKPFSFVNTPDTESLRVAYNELREWVMQNPSKEISGNKQYIEKCKTFGRLFYKIPHELVGPWLSKDFVIHLANLISFEYERISMLHQAESQQ